MGARRPWRSRKPAISLGQRTAPVPAALPTPLAARPGTRRPVRPESLWPPRNVRERPRVVQRLVRRRLLRRLSGPQSFRTTLGHPPRLSRRLLAPPHQDRALLRPLQHSTQFPVRRLRLPHRLRPVNASWFLISSRPSRKIFALSAVKFCFRPATILIRPRKPSCSKKIFSTTSASSSPAEAPASAKAPPSDSSNSAPKSTSAAAATTSSSPPSANSTTLPAA